MNKLQKFVAKMFGMASVAEGGAYMTRDTSRSNRRDEENRYNERGNRYQDYASATNELWKRFMSQAKYGSGAAHSVVSFLTGEIAGNGAILSSSNEKTQEFLNLYTKWNRLDSIGIFNAVRIGVIEGKCLRVPKLVQDDREPEGCKIATQSLRYTACGYKVLCDPLTYEHIGVEFSSDKRPPLAKGKFVLVQIDGFEDDPNNTPAPAAKCLQYFEAIDHVASDLRMYNKTFPAVTPVFEVEDVEAAVWLHGKLFRTVGTDVNGNTVYKKEWEIGDAIIIPGGTAKILEPQGNAVQSLVQELMVNFRVISGITGIPVIFLGPVDLPSNRATAQEQPEMINAATLIARESWEAALVNEARLAAEVYSEATLQAIPTDDIQARMPFTNMSWLKLISEFWAQLGLAEVVSNETIREMIPVVDPRKEKERFEAQKQENMENQKAMIETMRSDVPPENEEEAVA